MHESRGRMRLKLKHGTMSIRQADLLEAWLSKQEPISRVTVHERTGCFILYYTGERARILQIVRNFSWEEAEKSITLPAHSTRALNREFQEKLVGKVALKLAGVLFFPKPIRIANIVWHAVPFLRKGLH